MVEFMSLAAAATTTANTGGGTGGGTIGTIGLLLMWGGVILVMYFLMIRPQRKKQKEEQKMREDLRVGDEITTIGGICGRVVSLKEDSLVIETGADRSKMTIKKWAIQSNETVHDAPLEDIDDDDDDDDI